MGPTACGKSSLAMSLAERLSGEIISVDSMAIYRGMDIGTAKPTIAKQQKVRHHLIDICEPSYNYSAAEFCIDAQKAVQQVFGRGHVPILVGGTMFYFYVLQHGLSPMPAVVPELREKIRRRFEDGGVAALYEWLQRLDPDSARCIHPNDAQRLQRAIEVYLLSGRKMVEQLPRQKPSFNGTRAHRFSIGFEDRASLHQRIEKRFDEMLQRGLADELTDLLAQGKIHTHCNAIRGVGYRQMWQYLSGRISYHEMRQQAIIASRQLAKRQLTWLRQMDAPAYHLDRMSGEEVLMNIEEIVVKE